MPLLRGQLSPHFQHGINVWFTGMTLTVASMCTNSWVVFTAEFAFTFTIVTRAGLVQFCTKVPKELFAVHPTKCENFLVSPKFFQTQLAQVAFVLACLQTLFSAPTILCVLTQNQSTRFSCCCVLLTSAALFNLLGVTLYLHGAKKEIGDYVLGTATKETTSIRLHVDWGLPLFCVGNILMVASGVLLSSTASMHQEPPGDSLSDPGQLGDGVSEKATSCFVTLCQDCDSDSQCAEIDVYNLPMPTNGGGMTESKDLHSEQTRTEQRQK
ncbi:uncharacterized protein LOC101856873 [Aplysia californica]|uniref:Uncharacterized protein LOC101856873 n=1 Tax=Aplysia californica TaxID=6500 RepID=A0ABM0JG30_APLCA|nr:uncharacterized protein LOC101856873 [Aplysia californica]